MCAAGGVAPGDTVVEIGPGTGILTQAILARGATVIAVETDDRALAVLNETFAPEIAQNKLILHKADARELDLPALGVTPHAYKVIANIPYYISGLLFRTFLDSDCQPSDLVFLVQKEVAERIARAPKESLLSLSVKVFGDVSYVNTIKKSHFTPPPKIDSAIISVHDISDDYFDGFTKQQYFQVLKAGFGQKRKQLQANLKPLFPKETIETALQAADLPNTVRAEDINLTEWGIIIKNLFSTT